VGDVKGNVVGENACKRCKDSVAGQGATPRGVLDGGACDIVHIRRREMRDLMLGERGSCEVEMTCRHVNVRIALHG
jgi:hypothetical protein